MTNTGEKVLKRRKYIGVGGDAAPSIGVLEGDILRLLWDAGKPQSSVQVYQSMTESRKSESKEMQSPSTIAVTLSRMVEKNLLDIERLPNGGKGYYEPRRSRADVVSEVLNDVCMRLTGQPLGTLLACMQTAEFTGLPDLNEDENESDSSLDPLIQELRRRQLECNQAVVIQRLD